MASIWYPADLSAVSPAADPADYILAQRFTVSETGTIQRLYYWKADPDAWSTVTMSLINASAGTLLGQVDVTWGAGEQWVFADLPSAVTVSAGPTYAVCLAVNAADDYTYDDSYSYPVTVGSITTIGISFLQTSADTAATGFFDGSIFARYLIDVEFTPRGGIQSRVEATYTRD